MNSGGIQARGIRRKSHSISSRDASEGVREKIQNGKKGIRDLKARLGREYCISRGGRLNSRSIQARGVRERSGGDQGGHLQE